MPAFRPAAALLCLLAAAGCDTGGPDSVPESAVVGSWTSTEFVYRELATPAADVPFLSPYEPADGEIAVTGLDAPPLRYIVHDEQRSATCTASPCLGAVNFQSWPEGRRLPAERTALELRESGPVLAFTLGGTRSTRSGAAPVEAAVGPSSITVPEIQFGQGAGAVTVGGRLDFALATLAGGVEVALGEPDRSPASATARRMFEPDGAYRLEVVNGSTTTLSEEGTWRLDGDRLTLALTAPQPATREYTVRTEGGGLQLVLSAGCDADCLGHVEARLLLPPGALASARFERVWAHVPTAP